jgi:hypothetical protein
VTRATKPSKPAKQASPPQASPPGAAPKPAAPKPAAAKPAAPKPAPPKPAPPKAPPLSDRLAEDPAAVVLEILREESEALTVSAIKQRLVDQGVDKAAATRAWTRAQEKVRYDDHVIAARNSYRWTEAPREISAGEALSRLPKLTRAGDAAQREKLWAVIQSALANGSSDPAELAEARSKIAQAEQRIGSLEEQLSAARAEAERAEAVRAEAERAAAAATAPAKVVEPDSAHAQYERAERRRAARERQARIDAMAAVAELAAEVEELTAKRATSEVLLEHTRALTGGSGLEAIGRAGESISYDETRHDPVGDFPNDGDPVVVIRPGYLWHAPGEAVLISKALVTRA